jgi:hypothetical protein
MKRFLISLGLALALCGGAQARDFTSTVSEGERLDRLRPEFKTPDEPGQLFFVQRSPNANTVVYAARLDGHGNVDWSDPVEAFWRKFNIDGAKVGLNFMERMLAYGVHVEHVTPGKSAIFTIAALPERKLILTLDAQNKPQALIRMGTHTVKLVYVYLHVVEGGLMPKVPELDILGTDIATGRALHEHLVEK